MELPAIALYPTQLESLRVTMARTLLVAMLVPAKCIVAHEFDTQRAYMSSRHLASLLVHSRFDCSTHWLGQASRPPIDLDAQLVNSAAPLVNLTAQLVNLAALRSIWSFICHLVDSVVSLLNPGGRWETGKGTGQRRDDRRPPRPALPVPSRRCCRTPALGLLACSPVSGSARARHG
jgi:hypothetical protein